MAAHLGPLPEAKAAQATQHRPGSVLSLSPAQRKNRTRRSPSCSSLGVSEDPEAQQYLEGLGLLPVSEEVMPSGTGGHSLGQNTQSKEHHSLHEKSSNWTPGSRYSLPTLQRVP